MGGPGEGGHRGEGALKAWRQGGSCRVEAPHLARGPLLRCPFGDRPGEPRAGRRQPLSPPHLSPLLNPLPNAPMTPPSPPCPLARQIPLVIRETARKYQLILAHRLVAQKAHN